MIETMESPRIIDRNEKYCSTAIPLVVVVGIGNTNNKQSSTKTPTHSKYDDVVKSSQVVGLRDCVAIIRTLIFSSPHPYAVIYARECLF